jgi:dihydrolipoamide dehydrogenase
MNVATYDLIVIGAGPAGYIAAAIAANRNERVLLVERDALGGTCLNRGCIPTKTFCRSAQVALDVADAAKFGILINNADATATIDMPAIVARKNNVVVQLREAVAAIVAKAEVVSGEAQFIAPHTITVGNIQASAPKIIIATGSESATLPIPGVELAVTSTELLNLTEVPQSLAIVGGGVIGLEFASIFAAFGCNVSVIEYCREILPQFDKDIAKRLRSALQRRGITFYTASQVTAINSLPSGLQLVKFAAKGAEKSVEASMVLMAVGRKPVIPPGLDNLGLEVTKRGIVVNENMETSIPGVFAVGDCNGLCLLAHAASAQAEIAMGKQVNLNVVPSAVFTAPECAMVGLTEEQCLQQELNFKVGKAMFHGNGKALAMNQPEGLIKVIVDTNSNRLLGAHICGPHAADLITEAALAMSAKVDVATFASTIHPHPTLSEALHQAIASTL